MEIDLDSMSEQQLRQLHGEITHRLQMHVFVRNVSQLGAFNIGDRVVFDSDQGTIEGVVKRINQKTATIQHDDGRRWRVSPGFLSGVVGGAPPATETSNLLSFANKNLTQK